MSREQKIGIVGLGGFAGSHHHAARKLEETGRLRVVATCDPAPELHAEKIQEWEFDRRGVQVFPDLDTMLDACSGNLDWVVIATPIPLHAPMHATCRARGLSVYLEKPPTLCPQELESMIVADVAQGPATNVGFNFLIQPERQTLKERIANGEFGALREIRLFACWGRADEYFRRNNWAGRLLGPDGRPLLDSCFANAMSHYVQNCLHWSGVSSPRSYGSPSEVRAALFRSRDIEGPDTVLASIQTLDGPVIRCALTHAVPLETRHYEEVVLEKATIRFVTGESSEVRWHSGETKTEQLSSEPLLGKNLLAYADYFAGESEAPPVTLEETRGFVHSNAMLYLSAKAILSLPDTLISTVEENRPNTPNALIYRKVRGMDQALLNFLESEIWPSAWGCSTPEPATPSDLPLLPETLRKIRAS